MNNNNNLSDIDKLTLSYFTNVNQFNKYNELYENANKKSDIDKIKQDKKFYRKRIIQITKDLFVKKSPSIDLKKCFDNYVMSCIEHFKMLDKHDIIQQEYQNIELDCCNNVINLDLSFNNLDISNNFNSLMFNSKEKTITMKDYVITKKTINQEKNENPKKKTINLKDPKLKMKGVKNKKKLEKE